jgi:hypothetical protein
VATTTITAGVEAIETTYLPLLGDAQTRTLGLVNAVVTALLLLGVAAVLTRSAARWFYLMRARRNVGGVVTA